jgi:hypothetical protein
MEYGIIHSFSFVNGVLIKTPIGYVSGLSNIVTYNNNNNNNNSPDRVIEVCQFTIPQNYQK